MEPKHRALPVGYRFRPTDCEISKYLLTRKALGLPIEVRTVPEELHEIFSMHPRDLPGYRREEHWYYFCRKRNNQVTANTRNIWTQVGEESNVLDPKDNDALVGIKRPFTLVEDEEEGTDDIYMSDEEEPPKFKWFLDEISLPLTALDTDWVFCHIYSMKIEPDIVEMSESESESEDEEEDNEESVSAQSVDLLREKDVNVLPPSPSPP
ncbi:unnamed protein product [Thlaspi arvense]|uniref:NAC domain-containing protein n=1 Tax=Thlaspi arvense TaxID=13288 RepID=A0AAU9TC30_THLAR|nr:unnamed protein product [Thlaspi arvense]